MPYLLVSVENSLAQGPTTCGDASAPADIMKACKAVLQIPQGFISQEYLSPLCPREILNILEGFGYRVISSCGAGQTYVV